MVVRLKEWVKPLTWWDWVEITDNNVLNLRLRDENNLIIVNQDHEAYVDLQLESWLQPTDTFPVWVTTGRVLVADGRPATWTVTISKTTSWDYTMYLYADNGIIYVDNGTGSWRKLGDSYFKTQTEYDNLPSSKNSDWNLYIIVDAHKPTITFTAFPTGRWTVSEDSIEANIGDAISTSWNTITIWNQTVTATANAGYYFHERGAEWWLPAEVTGNLDISAGFSDNQ